jgi:hypothetical protein
MRAEIEVRIRWCVGNSPIRKIAYSGCFSLTGSIIQTICPMLLALCADCVLQRTAVLSIALWSLTTILSSSVMCQDRQWLTGSRLVDERFRPTSPKK